MQRTKFIVSLLFAFFSGFCNAQTDTDEIMEILVEESKVEAAEVLQNNPNLRSVDVEAKDGILIYNYLFKEGTLNQLSDEEIELMKQSIIPTLKASFDSMSEEDSEEDFTIEELFEHLKGFQFIYIEEKTLKGFQIDISSDEIRNAKPAVREMDELTTEKVMEHFQAEQYANEIAKFNKEFCPMVSGIMVIDSMIYDYENLHYYCRIDSVEQLVGDIEAIKKGIRTQMVFAGNESNFFSILAGLDGGFHLHFHVQNSDSSFTIIFTPEEVKEMIESDSTFNEAERARFALNAIIETTNAQLPMQLDFMTLLDTMYIEGDNLYYQYTILDNFKQVKKNKDAIEWTIRTQLMSNDAQVQYMVLMCIRAGYGMCHRYLPLATDNANANANKKKAKKQKKAEVVEFCIPVEELKGYVSE